VKPRLQSLWAAFPDHGKYATLNDLYTWLGGPAAKNIDKPGFGPHGNTCATRLSVAFNRGGAPISAASASAARARTLGTADGSRIIFQVSAFRAYLVTTLGKPTLDNTSPFDDAFRGKKGIIAFIVNWQGATGHIALWNGVAYREPGHDNYAAYVNPAYPRIKTSRGEFWELP
jgi:hypothetical protein